MRSDDRVAATRRPSRSRRLGMTSACALMAGAAWACSDGLPTDLLRGPATGTPFVASVAPVAPGTASPALVYVSLPPGSLPGGERATLRVVRTGSTALVPMHEGGFDPVALSGVEGDSVAVLIQPAGGPPARYGFIVPKGGRPTVVRTNPPKDKRDVPLNARMLVVFSEPVDAASLTSASMQLWRDGERVAGRLALTDAQRTSAELVPTTLLDADTEYELVISRGIRDDAGHALDEAVTLRFTTGAAPASPPFELSRAFSVGSGADDFVAFVSLPPGVLAGSVVEIRNRRTGAATDVPMTDDRLDPVAVPARTGDVLELGVRATAGGADLTFAMAVPPASSPRVVRTSPRQGQKGVWIESSVDVVFSEPISDPDVAGRVRLLRGPAAVTGTVIWTRALDLGPLQLGFRPAAPLATGTEYLLSADGLTGTDGAPVAPLLLRFTTDSPPSGAVDAILVVTSFSMIEYQYPSTTGYWFYSPLLSVAEQGGRSGARIIEMRFVVPGLGNLPAVCGNYLLVGASQGMELFSELYGDWELAFFGAGRAAAGEATATIIFVDDAGRTDTLFARAAVTPGALPTTYTGGNGHRYSSRPTC